MNMQEPYPEYTRDQSQSVKNEETDKMKLTVQNIYDFYSRSPCERRLFYVLLERRKLPRGHLKR